MRNFDFDARTRDYSKKNAYWPDRASQIAYDTDKARDALKTGTGGLKDHFMGGYVACLEKAVGM